MFNISRYIQESIEAHTELLNNKNLMYLIEESAIKIVEGFKDGRRLFICGNGGSAADAQHIAAELTGRFAFNRPPLDVEALHCNTSHLTAVANDFSFEEVYSRLIEAKGKHKDMLIAISTSGNSVNILKAIETAKEKRMFVIGLTGKNGGKMEKMCDIILKVPSEKTPIIQQLHILIGHIICAYVEEKLFGQL